MTKNTVPAHVAILGMGPSLGSFVELTKRLGGASRYCDEVWGINAVADVIRCDRVFHMDDIRIQEIRAAANPESNIAAMIKWLKRHPGPIYTSRPREDYPGLVAFPLEAVVNHFGYAYFNSTAAYAVAYALHIGVSRMSLFGFDFTYPNAHHAEKGRACVEFWLGLAAAHGVEISIPQVSSLMDGCEPQEDRVYGYDTVHLRISRKGKRAKVSMTPRDVLPTAAEIEARYDHNKHPSPLVKD